MLNRFTQLLGANKVKHVIEKHACVATSHHGGRACGHIYLASEVDMATGVGIVELLLQLGVCCGRSYCKCWSGQCQGRLVNWHQRNL